MESRRPGNSKEELIKTLEKICNQFRFKKTSEQEQIKIKEINAIREEKEKVPEDQFCVDEENDFFSKINEQINSKELKLDFYDKEIFDFLNMILKRLKNENKLNSYTRYLLCCIPDLVQGGIIGKDFVLYHLKLTGYDMSEKNQANNVKVKIF